MHEGLVYINVLLQKSKCLSAVSGMNEMFQNKSYGYIQTVET